MSLKWKRVGVMDNDSGDDEKVVMMMGNSSLSALPIINHVF